MPDNSIDNNANEESDKLKSIYNDSVNGIKKNETKITFVGSNNKKLSNEFLKKLREKFEENDFKTRYFKIPERNSEYFSNKKTYLTEILDELLENKEKPILEAENVDNQPELETEELKNLMGGLSAMFKSLMPALNSLTDKIDEDMDEDEGITSNEEEYEKLDIPNTPVEKKSKTNIKKSHKSMKIDWEDEEDEEEKEFVEKKEDTQKYHDIVIEKDRELSNSDYEPKNNQDIQEVDDELELENEDYGEEENPEEIEGNINDMMNMLKNSLGPVIGNLTNMFGNLSEKMKDLEEDLDEIADDIEKSDEDMYYIDEEENEEVKNVEDKEINNENSGKIENNNPNEMPNIKDLSNLLGNLTSQLKNLGMFSEDSINEEKDEIKENEEKEEAKIEIEEETNENRNQKLKQTELESNYGQFTSDPRNDMKSALTSIENSDFFEEIIEEFEFIAKTNGPLIILIEDVNNSSEFTFNVFEEILMHHKAIPLIIIAGYNIESIKSTNSSVFNKNLRLLLTKYRIDGFGLDIRL